MHARVLSYGKSHTIMIEVEQMLKVSYSHINELLPYHSRKTQRLAPLNPSGETHRLLLHSGERRQRLDGWTSLS